MNLSNPANLLIAGIYLVLVAILTFFSMFGVYILIRYGTSRGLSATGGAIYSLLYIKILFDSYRTLQVILT